MNFYKNPMIKDPCCPHFSDKEIGDLEKVGDDPAGTEPRLKTRSVIPWSACSYVYTLLSSRLKIYIIPKSNIYSSILAWNLETHPYYHPFKEA